MRNSNKNLRTESRVLVFAPFGKDATLIADTLEHADIPVHQVGNSAELVVCIREGAGACVLTEEALEPAAVQQLSAVLEDQPNWSDFPFVVLTGGGASTPQTDSAVRARAPLGNVTLLERPLRAATLVSAVQSTLRARQRQYEIRRAQEMLEAQVEDRTAALRDLSARLLLVQDEERRRLARELHDGLGQCLTAAKIHLNLLARRPGVPPDGVDEAEGLLDRAIADTRTISHLLHPPLLDEVGFTSAAHWYVDGFGKRSGITAHLSVPSDLERLSSETETALFRILQEALTNVHRHSGSPLVEVDVTCDDSEVKLTVRDAGKGIPRHVLSEFESGRGNLGVGLAGIRERVKQLGGSLVVTSDGSGTLLKAVIPVPELKKCGTSAA